jgi:hypothetical protein
MSVGNSLVGAHQREGDRDRRRPSHLGAGIVIIVEQHPDNGRDGRRRTRQVIPQDASVSTPHNAEVAPGCIRERWYCVEGYMRDIQLTSPPPAYASRMPSTLIIRGENNFFSQASVPGWKDAFNTKYVRYKTLSGCSHHGLLEDGTTYGEIVDSFLCEYD